MNPLIKMAAQQANSGMPIMQMVEQFKAFKQQWTPSSADAKIRDMLDKGQINRGQLEQAQQMASKLKNFFK